MSDNSTIFSGSSRYSKDFSQIIDRSVRIASLPLAQLQNQRSTIQSRQAAWSNVQSKFIGLRGALTNVSNAAGVDALGASYSDSSVAKAQVGKGALEGSYSLEIGNVGAKTLAIGSSGVTNPSTDALAPAGSFTLTSNGVSTTITPGSQTLSSLVEAINQNLTAGVSATLINVAPSGAPSDYRLSLQSTRYNSDPISLSYSDGATHELMAAPVPGSAVEYRLNGYPAASNPPLTSDSRTLNLSTGLSVEALKTGTSDITVRRDSNRLVSALSNLVSAFNDAVSVLDSNRGEAAGPLSGSSDLLQLSKTLRDMLGFRGSGGINGVADLGITFQKDGKLKFDGEAMLGMEPSKLNAALSYIGTPESNGLLHYAMNVLNTADDPKSGLLPTEMTQVREQLQRQEGLITASQQRIDELERNLNARMSAADALIASLEQQVSYFTGMFESMRASNAAYN